MTGKEEVEQKGEKSEYNFCFECARYCAGLKWCICDEESMASLGDVHEPWEPACPMFEKKEEET